MKLTDAQTKALRLILDNPRGVVAWLRGETGFLKIHGNTENRLHSLGLVEAVKIGTNTRAVGTERVEYDITVWTLTPAGYEALGVEAPAAQKAPAAAEDEVLLPLPRRFRAAYEAELAETHADADSAPYRQVWQHVTSGRPTAPRWLLGHLADVAALVAFLAEQSEAHPNTRTARSRGAAELLDLLARHGVRPWPATGHGLRPWGAEAPHCEDCAEPAEHCVPAAVVAAEAAVDQECADQQAAYEARLAAALRMAEDEIAAEYGEHMRPGQCVVWTHPTTGTTAVGIVRSVYRRGPRKPAADVDLVGGPSGSIPAAELGPLPELPDMGELIEDQWLITDKAGETLAHVPGRTREEALAEARKIPAVHAAARRDGGLASRPLWTSDLAESS
ncbi:hypothetical protein [Streptomyces candidus]|uniref:Uncharacterized protein n=1 Tax=Streptomyces candidus TaxID=67283 RepID=A0A7X0HP53_9ACTN|nr:hypothetical protein [Streptomyces candidus]MBB6439942.1 hypothetical protein [Streptomyces candidus]GHH56162.1 hypothetical protein GCM10018773_61640 [Streptomyces candidus]